MKKIFAGMALVIPLIILLLSGCLQTQIIEQIGVIFAGGFDILPEGDLRGTAVLYTIDPDAKEKTSVIVSTAHTSKGLLEAMNTESGKPLVAGQNHLMLFGKELASKGIFSFMEMMLRDPQIGSRNFLAVSDGRAFDLLSPKYSETSNIGKYLSSLIKHNITHGFLPDATLREFVQDYYNIGIDPVLPILEQDDRKVRLAGIALFKDDKLINRLTTRQLFYFKLMRSNIKSGNVELSLLPQGKQPQTVVISPFSSNHSIKVTNKISPSFKLNIGLKVRILEMPNKESLEEPLANEQLSILIKTKIQKEINEIIKTTQELRVDPVGFGSKYRAYARGKNLTDDDWRNLYSHASITVNVNLKIIRDGEIE